MDTGCRTETPLSRIPSRILIVGDAMGYPNGTGAASRVRNYAQGLMKAGADVSVACLIPTERSRETAVNRVSSGEHRGVPFEYLCGSPIRSGSFLIRRLRKVQAAFRLVARIMRLGSSAGKEPAAILLYSDSPGWTAVTVLAAGIGGIPVVLDICEFPSVSVIPRFRARLRYFSQVVILYRMIRGFIVISSFLQDWLTARGISPARIILVPPMIDPAEWDSGSVIPEGGPRSVVYSGNLGHSEELDLLWEAFRIVAEIEKDVVLRIVGGNPGDAALRSLQERAAGDGLSARLVLTGWLPHEQQRRELQRATICVIPRRKGLFSTAGVPNKLAEYLAAGKPVVACSTGDIPVYIRDGESGYLLSPDASPARFADALLHLLRHPDEARAAGSAGRLVAETRLDACLNGRRLLDFMGRLSFESVESG
jgi:glycosyltransferase involved in cell wall biosynthesis